MISICHSCIVPGRTRVSITLRPLPAVCNYGNCVVVRALRGLDFRARLLLCDKLVNRRGCSGIEHAWVCTDTAHNTTKLAATTAVPMPFPAIIQDRLNVAFAMRLGDVTDSATNCRTHDDARSTDFTQSSFDLLREIRSTDCCLPIDRTCIDQLKGACWP